MTILIPFSKYIYNKHVLPETGYTFSNKNMKHLLKRNKLIIQNYL